MADKQAKITKKFVLAGVTYQENNRVVEGPRETGCEHTLAAAKTGTLTTRTSASQGSVTGQSGHGVTTGARLDVYWATGQRRGMIVGTVSGTTIPLTDSGDGDDLPAATTALTLMVPQEKELVFDTADVAALAVKNAGNDKAQIVFAIDDDTEKLAIPLAAGGVYIWDQDDNTDLPFASGAIVKAFLSQGDSAATAVVQIGVLLKN